jgi:hypothetical protein
MIEPYPKRNLTPNWLVRNVPNMTPDEWEECKRQMRDRGWGHRTQNADIEWFLWGLLPKATRRAIYAAEEAAA